MLTDEQNQPTSTVCLCARLQADYQPSYICGRDLTNEVKLAAGLRAGGGRHAAAAIYQESRLLLRGSLFSPFLSFFLSLSPPTFLCHFHAVHNCVKYVLRNCPEAPEAIEGGG